MSESPTTTIEPTGNDAAVLYVGRDLAVVTAIERFDLDGGEPPGDDPATVTREPSDPGRPALDRPETARAVGHLDSALRTVPGFVAGMVLAGHDGELVLYSQWAPAGAAPAAVPDEWSLAPVLGDGVTRVDARTYAVELTAPDPVTRVSRAATPQAHFGVFTVTPADQGRMVELAREHAPGSMGTPGLTAINFHRSLDGRRVVNLGLWTGFGEFAALLARPGFTGGAEYWTGVAGFRPHYFDVAAVVTR
jgi:hypothetical protein